PKVIDVPIGTPISEVINAAGGTEEDPFSVIVGGPMMGVVATDLNQPITKIDSGLIVLPTFHPLIQKKTRPLGYDVTLTRAACIRCNLCTQICPRYLLGHRLEPDKIMRAVAHDKTDDVDAIIGALLCTGCGVCTHYGCVMELNPSRVNQEFKDRLTAEQVKNPFTEQRELHFDQMLRKVPTKRLIGRLGLLNYERTAPLVDYPLQVDYVCIPLKQHMGAPAKPVVKQGSYVNHGDLIGKAPEKTLGANIHTSIDGRIVEVSVEHITIQA
ncbi:MAG: 4Fe-4S dicluster domain-containing protein, partial [Promethearchaeota archaeon]